LRGIAQFGTIFGKLRGHIGTDLVAAFANSGPDGDMQIPRLGAEFRLHLSDGPGGDLSRGSSPACMNSGHGTFDGIYHQQGNAIGGFDRHQQPRSVFQERVAVAQAAGPATGGYHSIGVNLMQGCEVAATAEAFRPAGSEAMHQPVERLERTHAVDILRVLVEHTTKRGSAPARS